MSDDPRRHHFLPVCYLKGFTQENTEDGRLHGFNLQSGEQFASTPKNVGHKRDLYKLNVSEGDDAFFIERVISEKLEGPFARLLESMASRRALPSTPHEWNILLYFIAFQAVRVPAALDAAKMLSSQFAKEPLREISQNPGKFEQIKKKASGAGDPLEGTIEDLRKAIPRFDSGDLALTLSQNHLLDLMVKKMDDLLHMIARRPWRLLIADDNAPDLICSDHPVMTTSPQSNPPRGRFETWQRGAHLTFPLTRRMWLISNLGFDTEGVCVCPPRTVVSLNHRTALHADRFLYSPNPVFTYAKGKEKPRSSADLAPLLEYRERRGATAMLNTMSSRPV